MATESPTYCSQQDARCVRTGLTVPILKRAFTDYLFYTQGRLPSNASPNDMYIALAYAVRDRLLHRWISTFKSYEEHDVRIVSYLSAEFLMGPHLGNNLINLGFYDEAEQAMKEMGLSLDVLLAQEEEPGLGNGGLGRLAACFLDSLATLEVPSIGYGIRYEFGIFDQTIRDGWQVEITDKWLAPGNPWEIPRPDTSFEVSLGGRTEMHEDETGKLRVRWVPDRVVKGIAYDTPVLGYGVNTCNLLRLWQAQAVESFDFQAFNVGDYYGAVDEKMFSENITKVLYPNDETARGKLLRLGQQYFFVSCSLQDMIQTYLQQKRSLEYFHEKFAVQLNDTHPAIGVAELMRLLVDVHSMDWETAWNITCNTFCYTNHTLLPEALEKWSLEMFGRLLPRHLEIIYEINQRFLDDVRKKWDTDNGFISNLSLIDERGEKYVRMANLACVGSRAINGVAELHSELLKQTVLKDFYEVYPGKFSNKTNGVTPRRWLVLSNPRLTRLISSSIGEGWMRHLEELKALEPFAEDAAFREEWRKIKLENKRDLAECIFERTGVTVNPQSLFDVQVKRIHEYKRQHLNALHIVTLYNRLRKDPSRDVVPRTFLFGGKAAPGYAMAKLIIKLINSIADVVNHDPAVKGRLKVVFFPDFNVKNGQLVYPAAELSEQISTAGKEASGTGNMKFAMNGALTIGTLDGANVEIREEVGAENFFLFGLTAEEVQAYKSEGYNPGEFYHEIQELRETLDLIASGFFSPGNPNLFGPLVDSLLYRDDYMLFADYQAYLDCHDEVEYAYRDRERWTKMSILNAARSGKFSSDRSIRDYCEDIWHVDPVKIELEDFDMDDLRAARTNAGEGKI